MITTIPNFKELSGFQVYEQGEKFLSKQIIKHMKEYARQKGCDYLPYSHAETLIWDERLQHLFTIGARAEGVEITPVEEYYTHGHNLMLMEPVRPFDYIDNRIAMAYARSIDDHKYQKSNFISWINEIKSFGLIKSYRPGDITVYCYELDARVSRIVERWPQGKEWDINKGISIYHLRDNPNYKVNGGFLNNTRA